MRIFGGGEGLQEKAVLYLMQVGPHELPLQSSCACFQLSWRHSALSCFTTQSPPVAAMRHDSVCVESRFLLPSPLLHSYNEQGGPDLCAAVCIPRDVTLAGAGHCHGCIPFLLLWRYSLGKHLIGVVRTPGHAELLLCSCVLQRAEEGRCLQPQ